MMKIQADITQSLNNKLKIIKVIKKFNNLEETLNFILEDYFNRDEKKMFENFIKDYENKNWKYGSWNRREWERLFLMNFLGLKKS